MQCEKCGEINFDKLQVVKDETRLNINVYADAQWESTLITIKCLSCGYEFEEEC
ncbi:hypothetical protein C672_3606 [[Clostridium] bifermentans ATCC 638]|uniref:Uncharacterized protein n=1 Tax=Paraclostridium bifermentans ATCC 638 = DSM 14991 TaxID=1233171 RepID=T4VF78_PARBF|nr:hypothetical protein [Paraclostridium bifermentans]EQK39770.1 hypothetical protein C672_3606 [[Clostridium] bifermentans ATCC 638] [Paraclostridium bifermentans ATCC 638 = DSM 14991]